MTEAIYQRIRNREHYEGVNDLEELTVNAATGALLVDEIAEVLRRLTAHP